jgi:hypothetical protein
MVADALRAGVSVMSRNQQVFALYYATNLALGVAMILPIVILVSMDLVKSPWSKQLFAQFDITYVSQFVYHYGRAPLSVCAFVAQGVPDRDHPLGNTAHPIPDLSLQSTHFLFNLLHAARHHASAILQQTAIGGVMNIGFHDRPIYPHFAAVYHLALLCHRYHPVVQLADGLWTNRLTEPHQSFGIGHLLHANPAKRAIHRVGSHFPL